MANSFVKFVRRALVGLMLSFTSAVFAVQSPKLGVGQEGVAAPAIRVAPPAPVWDDRERLAELAARRARVAEYIGTNSVLVLFSAAPRVYTGDVDYEFRQENNLFYLTHLNQPRATLVLMPGHGRHRELLFMPRPNPRAEVWTGHMYTPEEAHRLSGVGEIWEAGEFEPFMRALRAHRPYRPRSEAILLSLPAQPGQSQPGVQTVAQGGAQSVSPNPTGYESLIEAMTRDAAALFLLLPDEAESREFRREQEHAARWAKSDTGLTLRNAWPIFVRLRLVKSAAELRLIQHAIDITAEALGRAMAVAGRAEWEYEFEAEVDYTFKRRGAAGWGYPLIVGCGPNANVMHYSESRGRCRAGDLVLMDVGAEFAHYSADVTRTFPVSGRFTTAQGQIYNAVLTAQEAAMRVARPGATLYDVHNAAVESLKESLLRLGLITERNSTQYGIWFMTGTSHWLGMNVHDVGQLGVKLEPGMVFTVEPGIYVRADALERLPKTAEWQKFAAAVRPAFEKYKSIGVRIEDDIVITPEGHRNMSAAVPRTVAEVENFMARAARELRAGGPVRARTLGRGSLALNSRKRRLP